MTMERKILVNIYDLADKLLPGDIDLINDATCYDGQSFCLGTLTIDALTVKAYADGDLMAEAINGFDLRTTTPEERAACARLLQVMQTEKIDNLEARSSIEDFWMWLQMNHPHTTVADTYLQPLLDEYHKIDQNQLEKERLAILEEHREQSNKPWKAGNFELPCEYQVFPGFSQDDEWNGWEVPSFTLKTCIKIIEACNLRFGMAGPSLRVWMDDTGDPEDFAPVDVTVNGERHTVYGLGGYNWRWSDADAT